MGDKAKSMEDKVAISRPLIGETEFQPCAVLLRKADELFTLILD